MKDYFFVTILLFFCLLIGEVNAGEPADSLSNRVDSLLNLMTLKEKVGQMNQLHCQDWEKLKREAQQGNVGSVMSITDPNLFNEVQKIAVEESRLGIPLINARDVIHGFKTIFPIPLGQAASFNPELVEKAARVAALEASSAGIKWTFAPMLDITQDPRWGRIAESLGEDPYLASVMGAAMVKGFQGESLSATNSIAACAKHFAGYGAAEGGRDYNSTFIGERRLRNLYLRPFEVAEKAGVATVMTAFNDNDGIPSSANSFLINEVLKGEWEFGGVVLSDWDAIHEMVVHGFVSNDKKAALNAAKAGNDVDMVSEAYIKYLPELVEEGLIDVKVIDEAVRRILKLKFELGLFENPYVEDKRKEKFYRQENLELATQLAEESVVLLKNEDQVLPLGNDIQSILIIGPLADAPHEQLGTWVFDGESSHTKTVIQSLREKHGGQITIDFEPLLSFSRDTVIQNLSRALSKAQKADVVIAVVGEESILSGEAHSLTDLNLKGAQGEILQKISETGTPLVTVVMPGRPLTIENEAEISKAVLYSFHPGTMGGDAIANVLWGNENPSGRLPISIPRNVGQIPIYYNHNNTGRPANGSEINIENIPVGAQQTSLGNKSYYLDSEKSPLYPFGYGLSYTNFEYSSLETSRDVYHLKDTITIKFKLSNTGDFSGYETAQVYIRDKFSSAVRPVKELVAFEKVYLKAGEQKEIRIAVPVEALSFWNIDMEEVVESGEFILWVGPDSQNGLKTKFVVDRQDQYK